MEDGEGGSGVELDLGITFGGQGVCSSEGEGEGCAGAVGDGGQGGKEDAVEAVALLPPPN